MCKRFKKSVFMVFITTCLMLTLSVMNAYAGSGMLGGGGATPSPTPVTYTADTGGVAGTSHLADDESSATENGGTFGTSHLMAVIGDLLISVFG
jgi:hypothetical protein